MPQQQQSPQQTVEEQIYQQRNEWPQMPQSPPQVVIQQIPSTIKQQSNSIWPEKLPKQIDEKISSHNKKEQAKDLEYSEEYGEESQSEGDDVTTTEAPKKVKKIPSFHSLKFLLIYLKLKIREEFFSH